MFYEPLAIAGLTITSGLALGIDAAAHRAAINVFTETISVLGNGLAGIYPRRHKHWAEQIIAEGGAIISEFPNDLSLSGQFSAQKSHHQWAESCGICCRSQ